MRFSLIVCAFMLQHGLGLPTNDTQPLKAKNCIKMTPERETEINTLLEEVTDSLNNIALKHDHIDITVLNIGIESHSDDESDEKETKLHVLINDCHDNVTNSNYNGTRGVSINKCDTNNIKLSDKDKQSDEKVTGNIETGDMNKEIKKDGDKLLQETDSPIKKANKDEDTRNVDVNQDLNNIETDITDQTAVIDKQTANRNSNIKNAINRRIKEKSMQYHDYNNKNIINDAKQSQIKEHSDIVKTNMNLNKDYNYYAIPNSGEDNNVRVHYTRDSSSNAGDKRNVDFINSRRQLERPHHTFRNDLSTRAVRVKPRRHRMKRPEIMILHLDKKGEQLLGILQKRRRMYPLLVYVEERKGYTQYVFL